MDLGWVSFSRSDTNKMLGLLDALRTPGAVDELGIGIIRDGFADMFFPGTSTVQTRAKYFLIVPFLLKEMCEDANSSKDKIREMQIECAQYLLKNSRNNALENNKDNFEDAGGIIGSRVMSDNWLNKTMNYKKNHWLARTPAEIYWSGLREYKIFNGYLMNRDGISFPGYIKESLQLKKELDENKKREKANNRRKQKDDTENEILSLWDFTYEKNDKIKKIENIYRPNWCSDELRIELTTSEAEYLYYKVIESKKQSLLAYILENEIDVLSSEGNYISFEELTKECSNWKYGNELLELANNFNELVYRLRIRYNIELFKDNKEFKFPQEEWSKISDIPLRINEQQIDQIFSVLHIGKRYDYLKFFLKESINLLKIPTQSNLEKLEEKLLNHEIKIKNGTLRSKLYNKDTVPPTDDSLIGGGRLDYRFHSAARIICDIRNPRGE